VPGERDEANKNADGCHPQICGTRKAVAKKILSHAGVVSVDALTEDQSNELHDIAYDTLRNEAPVVEQFEAEQDKGAYYVTLRGIRGAYFVEAPESDDEGVFSTLAQAQRCLQLHYGEFIIK
jgi:hypothetical protein